MSKNIKFFNCEYCDYKTKIKCNFEKHRMTIKHHQNIKKFNYQEQEQASASKYKCNICDEYFNHRSTLCSHKKKCIKLDPETENTTMLDVIKQMGEENMKLRKESQIHNAQQQETNKLLTELIKSNSNNIAVNNINNFNLSSELLASCNISDALFNDASGFLIS